MPRYLVERTFPNGLHIPSDASGSEVCLDVAGTDTRDQVTWVHSYVTADKARTYCIYDAPSPEAIRRVAGHKGLPVDSIVEIRVLDPDLYHGTPT